MTLPVLRSAGRRPFVETMEARILYSADPTPAVPAAAAVPASVMQVATQQAPSQVEQAQVAGHELVIIDSRVSQSERLIADLQQQRAQGRDVDVAVLGAGDDPVSTIGRLINASATPYTAVHLISHGDPAQVDLGNGRLTLDTVRARADQIAEWGRHLSPGADLMIYGCDVAANESGRAMVDALSALTGADVAASTDPTGAAVLGGNWRLEYQTGVITAASAIDEAGQQGWSHLLAVDSSEPSLQRVDVNSDSAHFDSVSGGRSMGTSASGQTVMVWIDTRWAGQTQVRGAVLDAQGNPVASDFAIDAGSGTVSEAAVAVASDGRFLVVWTTTSGNSSAIMARLYDASGQAITGAYPIDSENSSLKTLSQPAVTTTPNGWAVVWSDALSGGSGEVIKLRMLGSDGGAQGSEVPMLITPWLIGAPAVAAGADGEIAVTASMGLVSGTREIYLSRYRPGDSLPTVTKVANEGISPDVAFGTDGAVAVVYTATGGGGSSGSIQSVLYAPDGTRTSVTLQASRGMNASIIALAGDGYQVAWQVLGSNGDPTFGYTARLNQEGQIQGGASRISTELNSSQVVFTVAQAPGRLVYAFENTSGGNEGIYLQRIPTEQVLVFAQGTETSEDGDSVQVGFRLLSQPASDVQVTIESTRPDEGTVSANVLWFSAANWNVIQYVTVTGVDDSMRDGHQSYQIRVVSTVSEDPLWNRGEGAAVTLTNLDNDLPGVKSVASGTQLDAQGGVVSVSVVLTQPPTDTVRIPVSLSDPSVGTLSAVGLVFTSANWNVVQTVILVGRDDGGASRTVDLILGKPQSDDAGYGQVAAQTISLNYVVPADVGMRPPEPAPIPAPTPTPAPEPAPAPAPVPELAVPEPTPPVVETQPPATHPPALAVVVNPTDTGLTDPNANSHSSNAESKLNPDAPSSVAATVPITPPGAPEVGFTASPEALAARAAAGSEDRLAPPIEHKESVAVAQGPRMEGRASFDVLPILPGTDSAPIDAVPSVPTPAAAPAMPVAAAVAALNRVEFKQVLEEMNHDLEHGTTLERGVAISSVAVSTSMSIGYVAWLLRGGALLSSLMASMPAWKSIDPFPVLDSPRKGDAGPDDEDDSLAGMVRRGHGASPDAPMDEPRREPASRDMAARDDTGQHSDGNLRR